ncbi:MAG: SPASM domain-containing protein, partial [Candidatus Hodarchaeota archaeon]
CSVMPDGEVLGCQIAYDNRFSEGNVKYTSFQEIWQKGFSRFRQPQFEKECLECNYFKPCRGGCWGMRLGNRHCLKEIW